MIFRFLTAAAVLSTVLAAPVAAQSIEAPSADERLAMYRAVADAVDRYAHYSVFDSVHATVEGGAVTLTGKVTQPFKLGGIERAVTRVDGVTSVRNAIEVLPVSQLDTDLRRSLAWAIYGNPHFRQYGAVSPPIHIVVEHGRVTLEGVVLNETDRALARALARAVPAFSMEVNLRTPDEARRALETL